MSQWVELEDGSFQWVLTEEEHERFLEELAKAPKLDELQGGWSRNATLILK